MTHGYPHGRHAGGGAIPWLFAGALIIVALFGIPFALLLTGNSTQPGSGHHKQQQLAAGSPPAATTPAQFASPTGPASHTPKPTHKSSASTAPGATPQPHSPMPNPTQHQTPTVRLAATLSARSWNHPQDGGRVMFKVDDTGSAATGQITATITLPAGASMGGGGDAKMRSFDWNSGWNCQPTSTGGICTHAGIAAGGQAQGAIYFTLSGNSVCGQPVDLTAASGSASSSAQSKVAC